MRFDYFDGQATADEALVPDGSHECEIVSAKDWTSKDGSEQALIVTFRPDGGTYDDFAKFFKPTEKRDHQSAMSLAQAVGIQPGDELGQNLVGLPVIVTTKRGAKRDGTPIVFINGFAASSRKPEPTAAKPAAKRTATQKADAASGASNEDIPF